ncbi:MAG: S-layer homology domain-containing protein [Bacillota bacterium]
METKRVARILAACVLGVAMVLVGLIGADSANAAGVGTPWSRPTTRTSRLPMQVNGLSAQSATIDILWFNASYGEGAQFYKSDDPINKSVEDAVYGEVTQTPIDNGLYYLAANCIDDTYAVGSGVAFSTGLTVDELERIAVLGDFSTHGTGVFNLWFDTSGDEDYFEFDDEGKMIGLGGDKYALCNEYPDDGEWGFVIDGDTRFSLIPGGGVYKLSDIAAGKVPGIPKGTKVAFWVGVEDSAADGKAPSLELWDVRVNPSIVEVDSALKSIKPDVAEGDLFHDLDGNLYVYGYDLFDIIQEGIDKVCASGVVVVYPGIYDEEITINKSLWLWGMFSDDDDRPVISPTGPLNTVITVAGDSVSALIDGFAIEGPFQVDSSENFLAGIFVRGGADCSISNNRILDVRDSEELSGVQRGIAVFVGRKAYNTTGSATIEDNLIQGYQKGGIVVDNAGSEATITDNTVRGHGQTAVTAQNGIQVSRGAQAIVTGNIVEGNWYTGPGWSASGILLFEAGDSEVTGNTLNANQVAVYTDNRASFPDVLNNTFGVDAQANEVNVAVDATLWPAPSEVWVSEAYSGLEEMSVVDELIVGYDAFATIQAAVDKVATNGTVNVAPGTYEEAQIRIQKSLALDGPNAGIAPTATRVEEAVIKGQVVLDGGSVTIDGFEFFDNQTGRDFIAVYLKGSGDYTVENCIFNRDTGKSSDELGTLGEKDRMIRAIHIGPASCSAVIQNNLFTGSATNVYRNSSWRSAIWSDGVGTADNVVIEDNTFDTNRTALNLDTKVDNIELTGNKFLNNGTHVALGGSLGGEYTISGNEFAYTESVFNLSGVQSSFRLDATDNLYCVNATDGDFKSPSNMTLDELFLLESSMYHKGKSSTKGFARVLDDKVFVTPTGGSIQQAVDVADTGDTIYVRGTITVTDPITISKANLVIKGEGPDNTVIETSGSDNVFVMSAQGATLQDLHIRKTDKGRQDLVYISKSGVKIIGNEFSGQWQQDEMGDVSRAMVIGGHLTGLEIKDNTIYGLRQPAYIDAETTGIISNNTVSGTRGWVVDEANVTFTDNKWGSGDSANYLDIAILAGTKPAYYSDILALSAANNGALIEDQRVSPAVLSSAWVDASASPAGDGTVLKPYTTIGAALGRVVSGGTVNVKPGTYVEHLVLSKPVTLKGPNFGINPNTATRGAEAIIGGDDQVGIIVSVQSPGVVIDGFTIKSNDAGFPVYTGGGEGVVVDGLTISNNIVETGVRAVTIERGSSNVSVLNNRLTGASYGMRVDGPSYVNLKINGNVIEGSLTNSVAFNGTSVIEGFEFKNNTLTGRSANIAADIRKATVTGNVFTATEGSYCLNINLHDDSVLSGNTFNGDSDTDGLRLWGTQYGLVPSSDTSIVGNTFNDCLRGITLSPGNRKIAIGSNTYSGVTTQVWNAAELNGLYYGIQEAINEASPGDTINMTVGDFAQNVTIPAGKNGLSLVGAGPSLTTISPASGNAVALMGNISATSKSRPLTGITVEGFTLHSVDGCAFIALSGTTDDDPYTADLTLRNIVVDGGQFGIVLNAVNGATLDNVQVKNITTQPAIGALEMTGVSNLVLRNSRFEGNALAIRLQKMAGYGSNADNAVSRTAFIGNTVAIENQDTTVSISAVQNYWNTGSMPPVSHIVGNVTYEPWYVSSVMTSQNLSNYEASGGGGGTGGGGEPTPPTPPEPPVIAGAVSQPVETTTGGTVALEDNSAKVEVPPEAVPENVTVTLGLVTEMEQPTTGMVMIGGKVYEITAETEDGELITEFERPLTLTFTFTEEELEESGTAAEDLMVFYWDARAQAWIALPTTVDPETGTVTAITDHFTVFALMAKPDMPALPDVKGHWSETHVLRLVSLGIVGGYEDGTFRPGAGITREEFAKMVVLAAGLEPVAEPELGFADDDEIQGWARGYVAAAVEAGIITGLPENRFGPRERVTRQQAATMIGRALGVEAGAAGTPTGFVDDGDIESWALAAVKLAVEKELVTGFPDNSFKPTDDVTRAQAASMLAKLTVVRLAD